MCGDHGGEPPTSYASRSELAALPWFETIDGRLTRPGGADEPVVDAHVHLALAFVRAMRVNLDASHEAVEHYLPEERPLDLEIYANKNLSPKDLRRLRFDLGPRSVTAGGMRATHTATNLQAEMRDMGARASVLLPIDFPVLSSNAETYLDVAKTRADIVSLGSVHPFDRNLVERLDAQKAAGALGVKVHPAVQKIAPEHPKALELYRLCGERGLSVTWHCGPVGIESKTARALCGLDRYALAVEACPNTTFVLGHSGALQFEQGLELALKHPERVYLELSCQSLTNVKRLVREAPPERILFGSDWPFYPLVLPLAKALIATEGKPELRAKLFWKNACRLYDLEPATVLEAA